MNSTYKQLINNLENLKLFKMKENLDKVSKLVSGNQLSFSEGLLKLSNYKIDYSKVNGKSSSFFIKYFYVFQ